MTVNEYLAQRIRFKFSFFQAFCYWLYFLLEKAFLKLFIKVTLKVFFKLNFYKLAENWVSLRTLQCLSLLPCPLTPIAHSAFSYHM